jgi:tripartite ATP-independent transporter DctP family solute receptor
MKNENVDKGGKMNWKSCKNICIYLLIVVMLPLISCTKNGNKQSKNNKSQEEKVIKLSHSHQSSFSSEIHTAAWLFKKWVEDNSNNIKVKIYTSGSLGSEREVYEAMQVGGGASCVISGTAILNNFVPEVGVLDLPFLWNDYEHLHNKLDGEVGDNLSKKLNKEGFKVLAWMDSWGYRNIVTADKAITKPKDIEGLKIRTIQSDTYMKTLEMIGANTTPMAFGEVYTAMQTGVLDGFEHNATVVKANKLYEVSNHITLTKHILGPLVMIFSKSKWSNYSKKQKKLIKEAAHFARETQRALAPVKEEKAIDYLKEAGINVHKINRQPLINEAQKLQKKLASRYNAVDLLRKIRENK